MKLLDLFCGAGGAAVGYARAGFTEIVGVDIQEQRRYPFRFVRGDALTVLGWMQREGGRFPVDHADGRREWLGPFDCVHASPPCQAHTALRTAWNAKTHQSVIGETRSLLRRLSCAYIIENVVGAPLIQPICLCGTSFNLGVADAELRRHRLFESSVPLRTRSCQHGGRVIGVYGGHGRDRRRKVIGVDGGGHGESQRGKEAGQRNYSASEQRYALGIDWMTVDELSQAIPPAYTNFIGRQLLAQIRVSREQAS